MRYSFYGICELCIASTSYDLMTEKYESFHLQVVSYDLNASDDNSGWLSKFTSLRKDSLHLDCRCFIDKKNLGLEHSDDPLQLITTN